MWVCVFGRQHSQVGLVIKKFPVQMPMWCCCFLAQETLLAPVYPAVYWGPGDLVSSGEAACPAVTSMGT